LPEQTVPVLTVSIEKLVAGSGKLSSILVINESILADGHGMHPAQSDQNLVEAQVECIYQDVDIVPINIFYAHLQIVSRKKIESLCLVLSSRGEALRIPFTRLGKEINPKTQGGQKQSWFQAL
jgi:hypothetical protein